MFKCRTRDTNLNAGIHFKEVELRRAVVDKKFYRAFTILCWPIHQLLVQGEFLPAEPYSIERQSPTAASHTFSLRPTSHKISEGENNAGTCPDLDVIPRKDLGLLQSPSGVVSGHCTLAHSCARCLRAHSQIPDRF